MREAAAVATSRDAWDWITVIATLVGAIAATTAVIAFLKWALEQRRRPEALILWQFLDDEGNPRIEWSHYDVPVLRAGESLNVRVAMRNNGDALAESVLTNFVVPSCLALTNLAHLAHPPTASTNVIAGLPPEHQVKYFAGTTNVAPSDWLARDYRVTVLNEAEPSPVRLLFDISHPRFNASGSRWFGSLLFDDELDVPAGVGEPWPPASGRRRLRRVRAQPAGFVRCVPGGRSDIRDLWIE